MFRIQPHQQLYIRFECFVLHIHDTKMFFKMIKTPNKREQLTTKPRTTSNGTTITPELFLVRQIYLLYLIKYNESKF